MKGVAALAAFVVLTLLGNFYFKRGAMELSPLSMSVATLQQALQSANVWLGALCYGMAAVCWFVALSLVPLHLAITVSASVYIIVVLMAAFVFHEFVPVARWIGVAIVFTGLFVIGRTL